MALVDIVDSERHSEVVCERKQEDPNLLFAELELLVPGTHLDQVLLLCPALGHHKRRNC